ncbi:UNVERIFIED_CONTAM: hypothetical protein GTU68_061504 [Idotea baltica]|nr:hypothetical protein [Idotea baltica]
MKSKLFVSNIDFDVTTDSLREMFEELGEVMNVVIATDRETKRSKGFAFVEMDSEEVATAAIEKLNNKNINGRQMKVSLDRGKDKVEGGERRDNKKREYLPPIQRIQLFRRRRKLDPFTEDPTKLVHYTDVSLLSKFVSERGRILSRRMTGLSAFHQRKVAKAIKRAQSLGLMPYVR